MADGTFIELLQKVMALHAWDVQQRPSDAPRLVDLLLAQRESTAGIGPLEEAVDGDGVEDNLPDAVDETLYGRLKGSKPLRQALLNPPLLSGVGVDMLRVGVWLADVSPNRDQTMMDSSDALFLRLLGRWRQEPVTAEKLILEDLAVLLDLDGLAPTVVAGMADLVKAGNWLEDIHRLEQALEDDSLVEGLPPDVNALWHRVQEMEGTDGQNTTADLLLSHPRFSAVPGKLVELFSEVSGTKGTPQEILARLDEDYLDDTNLVRRLVQYRLDAAGHFLTLRKFAKLDALDYKWPDLYRRFNVDRTAVVHLEQYFNEPEATREEPHPDSAAGRLVEVYGQDEDLIRFLHLRPLLDEIYEEERKRYQQIQVTTPPRIQSTEQEAVIKGLDVTSSQATSQDQSSVSQVSVDGSEEVLLTVRQVQGEDVPYTVILEAGGELVTGPLMVDWPELQNLETKLLVRADLSDPAEQNLRELGRYLFLQLFDVNMQRALWKALEPGSVSQPRRLLLRIEDPKLQLIPWESLFVNPIDRLIFASSRFSALRYVPGPDGMPVYPESGPLRVLVMLQGPNDLQSYDLNTERAGVERMMDDPSRFQAKYLENASWHAASIDLKGSSPQVVHMVMPQMAESADPDRQIPFIDPEGGSDFRMAGEVAEFFRNSGVKLVTLTTAGTPTRKMVVDERLIQTAVALAQAGVPAVVAPTRTGITSASFYRTVYGALATGQTVEAAVLAGRRALKTENEFWIRYALFAGVKEPVKLIN